MNTPTVIDKKRIKLVSASVLIVFIVAIGKLFTVQIINGEELQQKALTQWVRNTSVAASRGDILDINGNCLAQSATAYQVLVWPKQISEADRERVATELFGITELGLTYDYIFERVCDQTKSEIVLARQIERDVADKITELKLSGIMVATDTKRYYPYGSLACQVLGFTNKYDGNGQEGLELAYDKYLAGTNGRILTERDRDGKSVSYGTQTYVDPIDGCDVVLTVDSTIQSFLEDALSQALTVNSAISAQGIIMNAKTGAIVALSTKPDYDPNDPPRNDAAALSLLSKNKIVTDAYEPGSTFKILTLASALDSGAISSNYTCSCSGGRYVNGQYIKCWRSKGHGSQNLTECAENSCNCAFMDMALKMGTEEFYNYIYSFGLGSTTGSGLSGEGSGIVTHKKYIRETDLARIGFGQSIAVTPLQLVTAVSAAANGGNLMKPYIVDRIIDSDGKSVIETEPVVVRRVISEQTSGAVCKILKSVVDNGSGKNAQIPGYKIGGKTGTAQKYEDGAIAQGKLIASFIGIAPIDNPEYVCLILVDEPKVGTIFGSTVAAPFVKTVLEKTLDYGNYPKENTEEKVTVPNVCGMSATDANKELEKHGLKGYYQAGGTVKYQVPFAGETAATGTEVLLYTDNTDIVLEDSSFEMISLRGKNRLEAYDALKELGLVMQVEGEYQGGTVILQSVGYGEKVLPGTVVKVTFG